MNESMNQTVIPMYALIPSSQPECQNARANKHTNKDNGNNTKNSLGISKYDTDAMFPFDRDGFTAAILVVRVIKDRP
jgi:hypothetical protein